MTSEVWTTDRENLVKIRWGQGMTCAQIAAELGCGISRNAVIGKVTRMGLPKRREPNKSGPRKVRAAKPSQRIDPFSKMKREPVVKIGAPKLGPQSVRFINRYKYQCAMFCEGEEGALGFVCGQPTNGAEAWCQNCRALIYQPAQERGRKAA